MEKLQVKGMHSRVKLDYYLCLLLLIPLILLFANKDWFFPYSGGPTDAWLNNIYFYSYGKLSQLFMSYKSTRLSWILKGWLLHRLFSPTVAYYVLNLSLFYACIVAFYYIVKLLFNRPTAFLATLVFATYSQFQTIISFEWDYHTHDAAANILVTLLLLLLATRRPRWKTYLFVAGMTCASAFQSPYVMMHGLSVVFFYWFLNRSGSQHNLWKSAGVFALGATAMTLVYCAINYYVFNGPFLYFLPQIPGMQGWPHLTSIAYAGGYWQPFGLMFRQNIGIIVPMFILVMSIIGALVLRFRQKNIVNKRSAMLCFLAFFLCIPIPTVFQSIGWGVLSIPHIQAGMDQFVFLSTGSSHFCFSSHEQ